MGDNANLVTSLAKDQGNVKILGLAIANGMVAMAGGIFCQEQRVFEISSGTGAIVIGLASVIIGTSLFKNLTFLKATTAVLIGSVVYKACVAVALKFFGTTGYEADHSGIIPRDLTHWNGTEKGR